MPRKTTISLIKCDVGSLAGHHIVPKPLFTIAEKEMQEATKNGLVNSFLVFNAGDDLELLMVHEKGEQNPDLFNDPAFSVARREAIDNAVMLRRMGEFEPARLSEEEMEYTTLKQVMKRVEGRFRPIST